jgi:hypothetical protein
MAVKQGGAMEKQQGGWKRVVFVILAIVIGVPGVVTLTLGGILTQRYLCPAPPPPYSNVVELASVPACRYLGPAPTPKYSDILDHFKYGSIGSEVTGLPYWVWKALPKLFPEKFRGQDLSVFGFVYETDADGKKRDLPIGLSTRTIQGVERAWFNCAVCHTGTVRETADGPRKIILAMPSNNLDFHGLVAFIADMADSPQLSADKLIPAMKEAGAHIDWLDEQIWRYIAIPRLREALIDTRASLGPLLAYQPAWGPGRVDTFNPYKVIQFHQQFADLTDAEKVGVADFPSIFNQGPRGQQKMELHWDGDNSSLQERNLSAALGAGVTEQSVDHASIDRVAEWLQNLQPPSSPYRPAQAAVEAGRGIYMAKCAECHGYQGENGYVFEGSQLGKVEPNTELGADKSRLDSYTEKLRDYQLNLFKDVDGGKYRFRFFKKTDGYANLPLDGLWLRAPYLHDGSVPTLADLLSPPDQRPKAFVRGLDVLDAQKGGFLAPACAPGETTESGFCFDTTQRGNGSGGHLYGVDLSPADKSDLLSYLLTF